MQYDVDSDGIAVNVTDLSIPDGAYYSFLPNELIGCQGSESSNCSFHMYMNSKYDYHFDLTWEFWKNRTNYGAGVNRLARRANIFVKNNNDPFTPNDACWATSSPARGDMSGTAKNIICCTEFKTSLCAEYQSRTTVVDTYGNFKKALMMKYQFNKDALIISIQNYTSTVNSTVQFESYSYDTFGQSCQ